MKLTPEEIAELKEILPEHLHKWIGYELKPAEDEEDDPPVLLGGKEPPASKREITNILKDLYNPDEDA